MNQKGFVLVESIVTSVFVLGLFTFIVGNILPLIAEYDKGMNYDNVESIYDAHLIKMMILHNTPTRIESITTFSDDKDYLLFDSKDLCSYLDNKNYCNKLLSREFLDVKKIIITNYVVSDNFITESQKFDRVTREYIMQMDKFSSALGHANDKRIIISFNDGRVVSTELLI